MNIFPYNIIATCKSKFSKNIIYSTNFLYIAQWGSYFSTCLGIMKITTTNNEWCQGTENDEYERNDADAEVPESQVDFVENYLMYVSAVLKFLC